MDGIGLFPHLAAPSCCATRLRGFGMVGLAAMLAEEVDLRAEVRRESAGAESAALSGARQARDLPVHARRAVAAWIPSIPSRALLATTASRCPSSGRSPSPKAHGPPHEVALGVPAVRRERHPGQRAVPAHGELRRRYLRASAPWSATAWRMAARCCNCTPDRTPSRVPAWARGWSTGSAPRTGICPASSPSSLRSRTAAPRTGAPASCPAAYQGTPIGHGGMKLEDPHRADRVPEEQGPQRRAAALRAGHAAEDEPPAAPRRWQARSRTGGPHPGLRTGVPHADRGARSLRDGEGIGGHQEAVRPGRSRETRDFGWQCLLARRLVERGVRFVQCSHSYGPGNEVGWDPHSELIRQHTPDARAGG